MLFIWKQQIDSNKKKVIRSIEDQWSHRLLLIFSLSLSRSLYSIFFLDSKKKERNKIIAIERFAKLLRKINRTIDLGKRHEKRDLCSVQFHTLNDLLIAHLPRVLYVSYADYLQMHYHHHHSSMMDFNQL